MCDTIYVTGHNAAIETRGDFFRYFGIDPNKYADDNNDDKPGEICLCSVDLGKFFQEHPELDGIYDGSDWLCSPPAELQLKAGFTDIICVFRTFDKWVNYASSWIGIKTRTWHERQLLCLDKAGNICLIGEDFMYARDNDLFPVTAYLLKRSCENDTKPIG